MTHQISGYHSLLSVFKELKLQTYNFSFNKFQSLQRQQLSSLTSSSHQYSFSSSHNSLQDSSSIDEKKKELYLLCAHSHESLVLKDQMIRWNGVENIHTIYSSKAENLICYVTPLTPEKAQTLTLDSGVKSCTLIPPEFKIHESLMFFFGLVDKEHSAYEELSHRYSKPIANGLDLSRVKLVVSGGIGVPHKDLLNSPKNRQFDNLKQRLFQSRSLNLPFPTASSHLYRFAQQTSPPGESTNLWLKYANMLQSHERHYSTLENKDSSADVCSFSKLSIEHTGHSIVIGNLHHMERATQSTACFASLLALLVTLDAVSDIRMRFPKKISNNYIKGIVQTNSRQEDYPYTAAGLDGTGQVIGIGKSS